MPSLVETVRMMQAEAISAAQKKKIAAIEKDKKLSDKERFKAIDDVMNEEEGKMCKECGKVHEGSCMGEDNTNDKSDDGEGMDKVQPKALKKKFDDRKDKDIDNDGDEDESDEYLHNRRKTVSKAVKNEEVELDEKANVKSLAKEFEKRITKNNALASDRVQERERHAVLKLAVQSGVDTKALDKAIIDVMNRLDEAAELDEAPRRKGAPKMTGDSIAIQRDKDRALNKALGRTKTGRKKPERTMTSTQRSLASLRKEEVELDEALDQKKFSSGAKALKAYAQKNGGVDKKDFMDVASMLEKIGRINILQAGQLLSQLNRKVDGMDTDVRERIYVELKKVGLVEQANSLEEAKNYEIKNGKVHISKANFRKVHNDFKNATKGKERMMVLDPKTQASVSVPVVFTEAKDDYTDDEVEMKKAPANKKKGKEDPKNKSGEEVDVEPTLDEAQEMTPEQEKMREKYVMKLKGRMDEFKKKYGDRAEKVMYATATKMAMKK